MKVLIPTAPTLLSSSVPINEYQAFQSRQYAVGERCVYGLGVYERKTQTDTFPTFLPGKIYNEGEKSSYNGINYICVKKIGFSTPIVGNQWEQVTISPWSLGRNYINGEIINKVDAGNVHTYMCLKSHISPAVDTITGWSSGYSSSTYSGGYCRYNNRYYKKKIDWSSNSVYSVTSPTVASIYNQWVDVTDVIIYPSQASEYWIDITDHRWDENIFYRAEDITIYGTTCWKAKSDIAMPNPNVDTTRWVVVTSSLPTNTDDWIYVGATNRGRMFDSYLSTYTESVDGLSVSFSSDSFNCVYVGNVFSENITIDIRDQNGVIIETKSADMTVDCVDILDYFIGDWMDHRLDNILFERNSVQKDVICTISFYGVITRVGIVAVGRTYFVGEEAWESSIEALDFSKVTEDTNTGAVYIEEGNELKVKSIDLWVDTSAMRSIDEVLRKAKGKPAVYVSENENITTYGYVRKKTEILKGPSKSLISLEIRELL